MNIDLRGLAGDQTGGGLPKGLAKPASSALARAGYSRLDQLARASEAELARLHGIGPKSLRQLRKALAEYGLSFAPERGDRGELDSHEASR